MRLMCVDDSGTNEVKFGEIYNGIGEGCPNCKKVYYLSEVNRFPNGISVLNKMVKCGTCNYYFAGTEINNRPGFFKWRFIEIDEIADSTQIEESILEPELQNV